MAECESGERTCLIRTNVHCTSSESLAVHIAVASLSRVCRRPRIGPKTRPSPASITSKHQKQASPASVLRRPLRLIKRVLKLFNRRSAHSCIRCVTLGCVRGSYVPFYRPPAGQRAVDTKQAARMVAHTRRSLSARNKVMVMIMMMVANNSCRCAANTMREYCTTWLLNLWRVSFVLTRGCACVCVCVRARNYLLGKK